MTLTHKLAAPEPGRAAAADSRTSTQRRWQILRRQLRAGHEPCFGTERRYACPERDCEYRAECLPMRAAWRR